MDESIFTKAVNGIKESGWNPYLVGGGAGIGTYALARLLGANRWLAGALGVGVGAGAGILQDRFLTDKMVEEYSKGHTDGERYTTHDAKYRLKYIAEKLGMPVRGLDKKSLEELESDIVNKLRLGYIRKRDTTDRLNKKQWDTVSSYLNDQPAILKIFKDMDRRIGFYEQPGNLRYQLPDHRYMDLDPQSWPYNQQKRYAENVEAFY